MCDVRTPASMYVTIVARRDVGDIVVCGVLSIHMRIELCGCGVCKWCGYGDIACARYMSHAALGDAFGDRYIDGGLHPAHTGGMHAHARARAIQRNAFARFRCTDRRGDVAKS